MSVATDSRVKTEPAQADFKMEQAEDLDNQALSDEAKAATQAATNIRFLVGAVQ